MLINVAKYLFNCFFKSKTVPETIDTNALSRKQRKPAIQAQKIKNDLYEIHLVYFFFVIAVSSLKIIGSFI